MVRVARSLASAAAALVCLLASRAAAGLPPLQDTPGLTLVYEDDFLGVSAAPRRSRRAVAGAAIAFAPPPPAAPTSPY